MVLCAYKVWACDDLCDQWHLKNDNRRKIASFAEEMGVRFSLIEGGRSLPYRNSQFDLVMLNDVIEHLHDSPYQFMGLQEVELRDAHFWVDVQIKNRIARGLYLTLTSILLCLYT